ncbi:MAG: HAMP domain-containing protein [Alphaproteobacteria bacterium]|nr:HAMP domain-containing protein [Alphaproteobacteria bacterium]
MFFAEGTRLFLIRFGLHQRIYFVGLAVMLLSFCGVGVGIWIELRGQPALQQALLEVLQASGIYIFYVFTATFAVILLLLRVAGRTISVPIVKMTTAMQQLVKGEDVDVSVIAKKGQIGDMVRAINDFKGKIEENTQLSSEKQMRDIKDNERFETVHQLATGFRDEIVELLQEMNAVAIDMEDMNSSLLGAAQETFEYSEEIADVTQSATDDVQKVAAATGEMSTSVREISHQMQNSLSTVQIAAKAVKDTDVVVKNMSQSSDQIGDIVSLINDIAGQTNLLALNATIEAARAGEAGKGFAVVANEVKNLASQTTKATEEIGAQITAIRDIAGKSVEAMNIVHKEINGINDIIGSVSVAIEQQSVTTGEINAASSSASTRTTNASERVKIIADHARTTFEFSEKMDMSVGRTNQTIEKLRTKMQAFIDGLMKVA